MNDSLPVHALKQERHFGFVFGGLFVVLGLWPFLFQRSGPGFFKIFIGIVFCFVSVFWPDLLSYPYKIWMKVGHILMIVNSTLIMVILFYFVISPLAFLMRFCGKDLLSLQYSPQSSYWVPRKILTIEDMTRQF